MNRRSTLALGLAAAAAMLASPALASDRSDPVVLTVTGNVANPNRPALDAFDDAVPVADRCAALVQWTSIRWPGYYEDGIVDGLQESFEYYFSEPFCPFAEGDG